jgi:DNA-binding transcriptional MerR regulator
MTVLDPLRDGVWTLDELVETANRLLPDVLPKDAAERSKDEVNPRLVRYYATLGLLPEARKDGREVRYLFDHLLHLLAVRRLLAEGFSTAAIKRAFEGLGDSVVDRPLERVLEGGVRVELVPDQPAISDETRAAFLRRLRASAGLEADARTSAPSVPRLHAMPNPLGGSSATSGFVSHYAAPPMTATDLFRQVDWTRIELLDGLELHVRDDFRLPTHRLGDEQLTQLVKVVLLELEQRRKAR